MRQPRAVGLESFQRTVNGVFSPLNTSIMRIDKTRQGYARERILKPAGYFFVRGDA